MAFNNNSLLVDNITIKIDSQGEAYVDTLSLNLSEAPLKSIAPWNKAFGDNLPSGWVEANGGLVTDTDSPLYGEAIPDLNGILDSKKKFLRGSSTSGTIGGEDTHVLSIAEMPTHTHDVGYKGSSGGGGYLDSAFAVRPAQSSLTSSSQGSGSAHNNLPSYYEIVYIYKIKVSAVSPTYQHSPTIYYGTNFTGSNPVKSLVHSRTLAANTQLVIGGRIMYRTLEYTISGSTITMVNVIIDDSDVVMVCD